MFPSRRETTKRRSVSPFNSSENNNVNEPDMKKKKVDRSINKEQLSTIFTSNLNNIPHRITSQRSVPAFLRKLFKMVKDPGTDSFIKWTEDGKSFLIENHEIFASNILPRFYKHKNFASFVRQLNMYDFHKIPHVRQGVLVGDNTGNEIWEFSNHNFQRGREDLLELVTRKRNRDRDETDKDKTDLKYLTKEITSIKEHQNNINTDLTNLRKENVVIWQETLASREKHQKHQQIIKKLLQLLTVLFSNDNISLNTKQLIEGSQSTIENDYRNTKDAFTPLHSNQYTNVFSENNYFLQSNTLLHSSKSTVATRHDVDKVEQNVENLAGQIGINLSYIPKDLTDFTPDQNYHQFINSISKEDKTKPFKMANNVEDINIQQPIHAPTWCFENFEKLSSSKDPPTNYHSFSESNQIHTPSQFISTQYYTNSTSAANTTNALVSAVYHTRQTATPSFPTPTYNRYSLFNRN